MAMAPVHAAEHGRMDAVRGALAGRPHLSLLVAVITTLATEPAVQAGRDATSNAAYLGAAIGLALRAGVALVCLFVAWDGQRRLRLAPVLGCGLILGLGWLLLHVLIGVDPDQDLDFYAEDGSSLLGGTYPPSEYPTGAVGLFALETWLGGEPPRTIHALVMLGFHLLTVAAIWSLRTRWSAWFAAFVAVWPLNLFHWEFRYDLAPTAFLLIGLAFAMRGRAGSSGVALGIGTALKWSPALAVGPLLAWLLARRGIRAAVSLSAGFVGAFAVLTLPFLLWDSSAVLAAYEQQGDRGITGESLWFLPLSVLGLATRGPNPSDDAGVGNGASVAVTLLQIALVAALIVLSVRVGPQSHAVALAALTPAAFLLVNRVFSSQFLVLLVGVWAFAAALIVASEREQLLVGVAIAGATFSNALVHPYELPFAWQLASLLMFVLAVGLTGWLVVRASNPTTPVPT
jgi:hypothetical protein